MCVCVCVCVRVKQWNVHSLFELSPGWFALSRAGVWEQKQQTFDRSPTRLALILCLRNPEPWATNRWVSAFYCVAISSTRFFCCFPDATRCVSLLTPAGHGRLYTVWSVDCIRKLKNAARRTHFEVGRHQGTSQSKVSFTSGLMRYLHLIDFWRQHRCIAAFDIPQSCALHSVTVEFKNKDGVWKLRLVVSVCV